MRVPSQRERGIGTTRAARAGTTGEQAASTTSGTANLILVRLGEEGIVPSKKVGRRRLYIRSRIEALLLDEDGELSP